MLDKIVNQRWFYDVECRLISMSCCLAFRLNLRNVLRLSNASCESVWRIVEAVLMFGSGFSFTEADRRLAVSGDLPSDITLLLSCLVSQQVRLCRDYFEWRVSNSMLKMPVQAGQKRYPAGEQR